MDKQRWFSRSLRGLLLLFLLVSLLLPAPTGAQAPDEVVVLINELDSDTAGTDVLEFIELYDGGVGTTPLDGLVVVFWNGSNDLSYAAYDLDTYSTDASGYFLLGNALVVPTPQIIFADNFLQNGADAAGLYYGSATDFPVNTPVTTANLIDAIVYDTDDADDPGLLVLLNAGQPQVNENGALNKDYHSNQRCPNGSGGARNTTTYIQLTPSPAAANCADSAAPYVASTDPADGVTGVAADANVSVTFSEPVNVDGGWFDITCTTSGSHTAAVSGGPTTFVLDPDLDFAEGEGCTATVYAAAVHDQDLFDPPDTMLADYVWTFSVAVGDQAPTVLSTDPADGVTGVAADANVSVTFSEPVNVDGGWFDITCTTSGSHTAAVSGGPTTFVLDPDLDFAGGESCTATVYAAAVHDQDLLDPPDTMEADYAWTFQVRLPPPPVIINELDADQTGTDAAEFVELYDGGIGSVSLAGTVLVFFNGDAPNDASYLSIDLDGYSTDAAGYFVVGNAAVPGVDVIFAGNTLQNGTDGVGFYLGHASDWPSGTAPTSGNLIDAIVYDTADADDPALLAVLLYPGQPQVNESSRGQSIYDSNQRCPNGLGGGRNTYTYTQATPTPDGANLCIESAPYVSGTVPANGATGVALDASLTVSFNEPVNAAPGAFALTCDKSGGHSLAVSGGPGSFLLDPDVDFLGCEVCTLTVLSSLVTDQDLDDPPDNMLQDYAGHFGTACACDTLPSIQGSGPTSPCEGQYVTLSGCVTGVAGAGFYMQDPAGDGNMASSDGIYVYMYGSWANAEGVEVGYSATAANFQVQEYYGATELYKGSGTLTKGAACTLPAPVEVPQIMDLGDHDVNEYENTEFMRVQMDIDGFVQGPTRRFTSRFPSGDPELGFVYTPLVPLLPNSPRLFEEDYAGVGVLNYLTGGTNRNLPDLDWGDTFTAVDLVGVMAYQYDKWQLVVDELLEQSLLVADDPDTLDSEAPFGADQFGVCTYNVENMFDWIDDGDGDFGDWQPPDEATYQVMLEKRARGIVENLESCPILGIEEMEGKDQVWADLEAWIETVAGPGTDFEWDYFESQDERDITVGVFYDTARVSLLGSTQRQGCTATDYGVSYDWAVGPRVVPNPCGAGTYPLYDRPPYVAQLQVTYGPQVTLIVNHFKSMSGGAAQTRPRREAQAAHNGELAFEYSGATPALAIVGDLNDYIGSSPIAILNAATTQDGQPLVNVHLAHVPKADQYTYTYNGESEVLDYAFVSAVLDGLLLGASPMHINADYPDVRPMDSDNCAGGICTFDFQPLDTSSLHASDHDPLFVRFGGVCVPVYDAAFTWTPLHPYVGRQVAFQATALGDEPIEYAWDFGDGSTGSGASASHAYAAPGDYVVTLTASNACGQEVVQDTVSVTRWPTMHVADLETAYRFDGPGQGWVLGRVTIQDQDAQPVLRAVVRVEWTDPSGTTWTGQRVTDLWGQARFQLKAKLPGVYQVCVTNVFRAWMTYDPGQNLETCDTVTVPGSG